MAPTAPPADSKTASLRSAPAAISIIVGSVNSARSIARSLASLELSCKGLDAEILVVDASTDDTVARIAQAGTAASVRQLPPGTLTPRLWSTGLAMSRGEVVAFTTGHFAVSEGWARALLAGIARGDTGVAGCLSLSASSGPVDWAVFYLRYSAFLEAGASAAENVAEIPGDNAAYRRDALDRHAASFADGFWEVDFHNRIRAEDPNARLSFVAGADARFGPSDTLAAFARQRFAHGCHFGAWRVRTRARAPWLIVAAAPIVPLVLMARIARRVLRQPRHRARFAASLPALVVLATAWAAGELWGAVTHANPATLPSPGLAA
jgi:glycosyltransferase involved in cell wall biosynthesis